MGFKSICMAAAISFGSMATASTEKISSMCWLEVGAWRLVTDQTSVEEWEHCDLHVPVLDRVFNTTELTRNRPVEFDPMLKSFVRTASSEIKETTLPGSDLLVLDLPFEDQRTIIYSLSANRFFASDLSNYDLKLIRQRQYADLKQQAGGRNPFIVAVAKTPFWTGGDLNIRLDIGKGRLGYLGAQFNEHASGSVSEFFCLSGNCPASVGWVPAQNLIELRRVDLPKGALPVVKQHSFWESVKDCGSETTNTSTVQFRQEVEVEFELETVFNLKVAHFIERIVGQLNSERLPVDTEVEWASFVVLNYKIGSEVLKRQKHPTWERGIHYVVVVEKRTTDCKTDPKFKFYLGNLGGQKVKVGQFDQDIPLIRNTKEQLSFVRKAGVGLKADLVPGWLIEHVSAAISVYPLAVK